SYGPAIPTTATAGEPGITPEAAEADSERPEDQAIPLGVQASHLPELSAGGTPARQPAPQPIWSQESRRNPPRTSTARSDPALSRQSDGFPPSSPHRGERSLQS